MVAHRPSALAAVDLILMMADGRAQAFGPKDEVFKRVLRPCRPTPLADGPPIPAGTIASRHRHPAGVRVMAVALRSRRLRAPPAAARPPMARSAATSPWRSGLSAALVVGVGGWATFTMISGAVIAPGQLVVESDVKKVQHPTGGVVGELRVRDGARVKAGDILIRLDDTQTRANLDIVLKALDELSARRARDEAERDGAPSDRLPARAHAAQGGRPRGRRT